MLPRPDLAMSDPSQTAAQTFHQGQPWRVWAGWLVTAGEIAFLIAAIGVMAVAASVAAGVGPGFLS